MEAAQLKLYYSPRCGYCHLVQRVADQLDIELDLVDIYADSEARQRLLDFRGRSTVPVLGIPRGEGEQLLGESRDIVAYLRNFAENRAA